MKIKIVVGCIVAVCALLMIPSIPAVECKSVAETNRTQMLKTLQHTDRNGLWDKIKILHTKELKEKLPTLGSIEDLLLMIWALVSIPLAFLLGIWLKLKGITIIPEHY